MLNFARNEVRSTWQTDAASAERSAALADLLTGFVALGGVLGPVPGHAEPAHGLAMHGTPVLPPNLTICPTPILTPRKRPVDPRPGRESFDSLNLFIVRAYAGCADAWPTRSRAC